MPPIWAAFLHDRDYKPGSVIDSHLSRHTVAGMLQPPSRKQPGKPCFLCGVAPDRVYSNGRFRTPLGALLPHLSTLTSSAQTSYPSPCRKRQVSVIPLRLLSPQNFRFAGPHFWSAAVYLCCTFPQIALGGRYPLSLPCGARTFLMRGLSALRPRLSDPVAHVLYFICRKKSNRLQFLSHADIIQAGIFSERLWI